MAVEVAWRSHGLGVGNKIKSIKSPINGKLLKISLKVLPRQPLIPRWPLHSYLDDHSSGGGSRGMKFVKKVAVEVSNGSRGSTLRNIRFLFSAWTHLVFTPGSIFGSQ